MRKTALAAVLGIGLASSSGGCYGSFGLSKKLHSWNGEATNNKFVNWLLFLGMVIIPVYGISLIVDALVLNSIEFWTGSSPVTAEVTTEKDGTMIVKRADGEVRIEPTGQGRARVVHNGAPVGTAEVLADGTVRVRNEQGEIVRELMGQKPDDAAPENTRVTPDNLY